MVTHNDGVSNGAKRIVMSFSYPRILTVAYFNEGYEIIEDFLSQDQLQSIRVELEEFRLAKASGGVRNIDKKARSVGDLATSDYMRNQAKNYLTGSPFLVRGILFDKTPESNWLVCWHQDRTVAVSERFERAGWGTWTVKDGTHHVQPPIKVLEQMVTFRIHLDATDTTNGCLRVMAGSHSVGLLGSAQIQQYVSSNHPVHCKAPAGSALVMRPHILHSSGKATQPSRRRVLHLEYSSYELPEGVQWA